MGDLAFTVHCQAWIQACSVENTRLARWIIGQLCAFPLFPLTYPSLSGYAASDLNLRSSRLRPLRTAWSHRPARSGLGSISVVRRNLPDRAFQRLACRAPACAKHAVPSRITGCICPEVLSRSLQCSTAGLKGRPGKSREETPFGCYTFASQAGRAVAGSPRMPRLGGYVR